MAGEERGWGGSAGRSAGGPAGGPAGAGGNMTREPLLGDRR